MSELGSAVLRRLGAPANDRRGVFELSRNRDNSYDVALGDYTRAALRWDAESLLSLSLEGGRREPGADFDPWTLRASFTETVPNMRQELRIGDVLELTSTPAVTDYLQSTGWTADPSAWVWPSFFVTDLDLEYRIAHREGDEPGRGPVPVYTVTATSKLARLGQVMYGDVPRPQESAGNRLFWLGQWMKDTYGTPTSDSFFWQIDLVSGEPVLRVRDVDRQPLAQIMLDTAADVGGYLYETQEGGSLTFEPIDGRRNRASIVQLDASDLEASARWTVSLGGTCNRLSLTSGVEGARVESTVSDDVSIDTYGDYSAGRETELLNTADAARLARLIVGRNSRPRWTLQSLSFDVFRGLPPEKAGPLFFGELGQLIELTGLPATAPAPRFYYLEGKRLELTKHELRLEVYVTEAGRTGAPVRWLDVPATLTWGQAATDDYGDPLTWFGTAAWFAPPPTGPVRWADVPADQAWWHLARDYFGNPEVRDHGDARVPTWASYPDDPTP